MSDSSLSFRRSIVADDILANYDFGHCVTDSGAWLVDGDNHQCLVTFDKNRPGDAAQRYVLHVVFQAMSYSPAEAYLLRMSDGEYIGEGLTSNDPIIAQAIQSAMT